MRKTIKRLIAAVVLLSAAASVFSASAYGAGDTLYRNAVALSDDVTYVNEISMAKSGRIESFSLELKPGGDLEQITSSCDTVFGGMTLSVVVGTILIPVFFVFTQLIVEKIQETKS